jgi:hypothetical protein
MPECDAYPRSKCWHDELLCLKGATSGLMHRRPSHRQAIGDEQCQAVSDDLRLAAAVKGHAASGPRVEVISRRNISRKHGFCRCGLSIKAGGSAALA